MENVELFLCQVDYSIYALSSKVAVGIPYLITSSRRLQIFNYSTFFSETLSFVM
jgi:hypothetical protein